MQAGKRRFQTRRLVFAALCIAVGVVLPQAFHMIPSAGTILLPMHIPVLISGFLCGGPFAAVVGLVTPLLSSLFTGMPPAAMLPGMMCELAIYGLASGLLYRLVRTKSTAANIYISLVGAMLAGRIVAGVLRALIFNVGDYSAQIWVTGMFVTALPGLVIQLILIPAVVAILQKNGLTMQARKSKAAKIFMQAQELIKSGDASCVVLQNDIIIHQADGRGVSPLLQLYENDPGKLKDAFVVDKVIGKAAAMILVLGGAKQAYGETMSEAGREYLEQQGITATYGRCVDVISNRARDGICPIERSVLDIGDAQAGLAAIKETVAVMMKTAG